MYCKLLLRAALVAIVGFMSSPKVLAQADTVSGGSLYFNGFSSYVDTRFTEHLKKFTVEAWVKSPNAPSGNQGKGPVHYENNFQINWDHVASAARGALVLKDSLGGWHAASFGPLEGNRWYHLAATYDGDTLKAYKNGELITANGAPTGPPTPETFSLKLGKHAKLSNPQFEFHEGEVDEVRIWERVLSAHELRQSMHLTRQGNESGLKLYYQLNSFQADSTLEAVSGRYSARLVQNPARRVSSVAAAGGTVVTQRFAGSTVVTLPNADLQLSMTAQDSITVYLWKLNEGYRGTAPVGTTWQQPYQYIWKVYDTTSTYTCTNIRMRMDRYVDSAINRLGGAGNSLHVRPHYSDAVWTQATDSVFAIAWGSGFLIFNEVVKPGQVMLVGQTVTSISRAQASLPIQVAYLGQDWLLKRPAENHNTVDVVLMDQLGRKVQTEAWLAGKEQYQISASNLAAGVYHLHISDGQKIYHARLLK